MSNVSGADLKYRAIELLKSNRVADAVPLLESAVGALPSDAEIWCLLGTTRGMLGEHEEAIQACRQATVLQPDYPEAWCNLGASQLDLRRFDDAIASLSEAVRLRPNYVGALYNLGNSFREAGRSQDAIEYYRKTLGLQQSAFIHINLGSVCERTGKLHDAADSYRNALTLEANNAEAHNNLGNVLALIGEDSDAREHYERALVLNPNYAEAHNNFGVYLSKRHRIGDAVKHYRRALEIRIDFADAWNNLANAEMVRGAVVPALDAYREAIRLKPDDAFFASNYSFALNYSTATAQEIFQAHVAWAEKFARSPSSPTKRAARKKSPIRVGYVSPDFRAHPVARFVAPVLANHDASTVEVFCYANVARPDSTTALLRSMVPNWRSIHGMSDDEVAQIIGNDQIDLLIDLAGHGEANRLGVFALRAAPVQASWLGYPNTTGVPAIDYYLTDEFLDPEKNPSTHFTERLIRLPHVCCYEPPVDATEVAPSPCRHNGYVTFGSFQNLAKVGDDPIRLWSRILRETSQSRLMMQAHGFSDTETRERFRERFGAHGVSPARLEFLGPTGFNEHLRLHEKVDIVLDTFPWNGHTTTCNTLWMGVPVIALRGDTHAARMAADTLRCVGLHELIADSPEHYVELAVKLAQAPTTLTRLRTEIREKMRRSDLCNGPLFTRQLEQAYMDMVKNR
ncbi:MAG TPA: tetratricopeptide repeat protein [Burkholderiales bacterium]|nr:tetratricopeptide repeat protein [Burkholderiales bacterium]